MGVRQETQLIIVPCHGVCRAGCTDASRVLLDSSWLGNFPGEGRLYVEHIRAGVELASERPEALLVFSGGQTRLAAPGRSEARSYWEVADAAGWWGCTDVRNRTLPEEYSKDSFDNLLYPIALFRQVTGRWPAHITTAGWGFKRERFDLHRRAIGWLDAAYNYVGINDPAGTGLDYARAGEKRKYELAHHDPFLLAPEWAARRQTMNPFHRKHPFRGLDAGLDSLFDFLDRAVPGDGPPFDSGGIWR